MVLHSDNFPCNRGTSDCVLRVRVDEDFHWRFGLVAIYIIICSL